MNIYLQHERHGTKVAICEAEAVADEKNGWRRYNVGEETQQPQQENEMVRRRGRPPLNRD